MTPSRAVVLARVPEGGVPRSEDFARTTVPVPDPLPGQVTVRVQALSLDPYVRSMLGGRHPGDAPVRVGDIVPGRSVGVVVASADDALPPNTRVVAETGWRETATVDAAGVSVVEVPDGVPASAALGALGMPGLTAYAAHRRHLHPGSGDTVVVSSATGGVGAVGGQLARLDGAHTVAIVGSRGKADVATGRLGYAAAVVRTQEDWTEQLAAACPHGVDAYLHMGDEATLAGVMEQLAVGARVSLVGLTDQHDDGHPTMLRAGAVMTARATVRGMVVHDHHDLAAEHVRRVGALVAAGDLSLLEERHVGLASAPEAFVRLLAGANCGKVVVELSD